MQTQNKADYVSETEKSNKQVINLSEQISINNLTLIIIFLINKMCDIRNIINNLCKH